MSRPRTLLSISLLVVIVTACLGRQTLACCSLWPAEFSSTRGYVGEAMREGKLVHLFGYQNDVVNFSTQLDLGAPSPEQSLATVKSGGAGNAMLLPIPAKPGSMTRLNVINTSTCPSFLEDMELAVRPPQTRGNPMSAPRYQLMELAPPVQVFDSDIYTIVLASSATDIPSALNQVSTERRPAINEEIFKAYAKWYPGWTFALCCFNTADKVKARPMFWWYEPKEPGVLFFPAIDAHDGNIPDLKRRVQVDHTIIVSSHLLPKTARAAHLVKYSDNHIDAVTKKLLPKYVLGAEYHNWMQQGDFVCKTANVRAGMFRMERRLPPGESKS